jgi:hypothetical protein
VTNQQGNSQVGVDAILDKALDGALASYTPAAPRIGLETRLQARLETEANVPRHSLFHLPWLLAGAAVIASVAGFLIVVHRSHGPVAAPVIAQGPHGTAPEQRASGLQAGRDAARLDGGAERAAEEVANLSETPRLASAGAKAQIDSKAVAARLKSCPVTKHAQDSATVSFFAACETPAYRVRVAAEVKRPGDEDQAVSALDRRALEEMRAASHPAPEEPLTQQERLLLRIVHKGDPEEIAMLNPEVREREAAEGEAEFRKWVEQSVKGQGE